ncbi:MAG: glycosyltransferase family 2 protein [Planctomycetota bacterium]|nr:glycosyltransferase family 2 protein [Planctomycetota bacterium]MDE1889037.1 glycosyltransferase family 2 protein [Planctomycetota bacterium]MDE2216423.1 glycosyltransferase family 2 protein [Planctomycetota bacterium]
MTYPKISVIIPAYNEENAIDSVIRDIPKKMVDRIVVVDNGSKDNTFSKAQNAGAYVVSEPMRGYGNACLKGLSGVNPDTEIVVFLDGDYSDYPEDMERLVHPIIGNKADITIGSRLIGERGKGALLLRACIGNKIATFLIRIFWGFRFTDLGPFRAIRYKSLMQMDMKDKDFGWTVEMQIKAIINKFRIIEVPVRYRKRIGQSKITGTIKGSVKAGIKIIYTILKYRFRFL